MSDTDLARRIIDTVNATYGRHPATRAVHAKGILCSGTFTPTTAAAAVSRAQHFNDGPLASHVRFSNAGGNPDASDANRDGRGMAVKITLPDGTRTDVLGSTSPVFPVRTPDDFAVLTEARPDPEKLQAFIAAHPESHAALGFGATFGVPASFARLQFHSIHAYRFVAADGTAIHARYHFVPDAGEAFLSDDEATEADPDFLRAELAERFTRGPVRFAIELELAQPGDPVDDPTAVWPEGRPRVHVADLAIETFASDRERDGDILVFDPTRVVDGIECTDDPILRFRPTVYNESVTRRT